MNKFLSVLIIINSIWMTAALFWLAVPKLPPRVIDRYQYSNTSPRPIGLNYEGMLERPSASPAFPEWKPGPLSAIRSSLAATWEPQMQTGDILFRTSDARAANGLQFSKYVEWATESDFSHASIVIKHNGNTYVLEIDDRGTHLYRFIDWLDTPSDPDFAIYRLKSFTDDLLKRMAIEIDQMLIDKPEYDFTFDDPDKLYCVESVAIIYLKCGIKLCEPKSVRELLGPVTFRIFQNINDKMREEDGQALPEDEPLWFVGNEEHGVMSSEFLREVYRHGRPANSSAIQAFF